MYPDIIVFKLNSISAFVVLKFLYLDHKYAASVRREIFMVRIGKLSPGQYIQDKREMWRLIGSTPDR
jgi:hypothetical protein